MGKRKVPPQKRLVKQRLEFGKKRGRTYPEFNAIRFGKEPPSVFSSHFTNQAFHPVGTSHHPYEK